MIEPEELKDDAYEADELVNEAVRSLEDLYALIGDIDDDHTESTTCTSAEFKDVDFYAQTALEAAKELAEAVNLWRASLPADEPWPELELQLASLSFSSQENHHEG
jgi:hypothetical protein